MLPIAVDAMGGDHAPAVVIEAAKLARERFDVPLLLVGDEQRIGPIDVDGIDVLHASQVIEMHDEPGSAVRTKKDASMVVAAEAVRDGKAGAMVSAGNTGAVLGSSLLRMGRIAKVARPAIATPIPVPGSTPTLLLDAGANADCQPQWLVQFAQMGSVMSRVRFGVERPRVALLSIGEEASKGNSFVKETHALLKEAPHINFIGNVEGRDFLRPVADVVVTDGFTGNVILKALEGGVGFTIDLFKEAFTSSLAGKLAGLVMKSKLKPTLKQLDPNSYGGAILLGVNGVSIKSHGSSGAEAIANGIGVAKDMMLSDVVGQMKAAVAQNAETVAAGVGVEAATR
jgi:glycerol-3-phosphate acyltransferase PlsX